ncbi:hypothetical protein ABW19_dt0200628 [Dactylella cylindrospora]|nr:hypothetical protein ABW19_dt0200628 [Dactylella cylindrospora]
MQSTKKEQGYVEHIGISNQGIEGQSSVSGERFHEGQPNSHDPLDSKDERSIGNRLAEASMRNAKEDDTTNESSKTIKDPLAPAKAHGNEPSRGAKIDAELQREDEEYIAKKS